MREAKRLFSKSKNQHLDQHPSPSFKSKLERNLPNQSTRNSLGPGQYNISFPIVKPKFEAIRKNNHTIIVKINDKLSPAFQSIEPRFKDLKQSKPELAQTIETPGHELRNHEEHNAFQNRRIQLSMMNRIKKLNEILGQQEESTKKSLMVSFNGSSTEKLQKIDGSAETINSLKLYKKERQRLHFLLKHIKPEKNSKGVGWSKYRQTKGNLYQVNNVPGPGSYDSSLHAPTPTRYCEISGDRSWQFKSLTRRGYYSNLDQKYYEVSPSRNRFISDINGKFYKVDSIPLLHETKIDFDPQQLD